MAEVPLFMTLPTSDRRGSAGTRLQQSSATLATL